MDDFIAGEVGCDLAQYPIYGSVQIQAYKSLDEAAFELI
jgi:hypothetical protein